MKKDFWKKEETFWSDGYFVCSTGDACMETIRKYIEWYHLCLRYMKKLCLCGGLYDDIIKKYFQGDQEILDTAVRYWKLNRKFGGADFVKEFGWKKRGK